MELSLAEVARVTGGTLDAVADPASPVSSVVVDSRQAGAGALFVALPGERVDGLDFAAAATAAGAVAVLAARATGVPSVVVADPAAALGRLGAHVRARSTATVVAVTGSSGKTSTKDLLADVLAAAGPTVAAAGSFNNEIGLPLTLCRLEADTAFAALEMGARGRGHVAALCELARPDVGVVLNVGSAHVGEYPDGQAGIAAAKGELAAAARAAVVLNADDRYVAAMARLARAPVVTFGCAEPADVRATGVTVDGAGRASFDLLAGGARRRVALRLVGAHHVANALAAAAVATVLGLDLDATAAALSAAVPRSRWRMEVSQAPGGFTVVNDAYNANPESMRAALRALVDMTRGPTPGGPPDAPRRRRAWAVLGAMGELGATADDAHDAVGRFVASLGVDRLVVVGEAARRTHESACLKGCWNGESTWVADTDAAARLVATEAGPDDVVLVKASRAAGLERVALRLLEGDGRLGGGRPLTGDGPHDTDSPAVRWGDRGK